MPIRMLGNLEPYNALEAFNAKNQPRVCRTQHKTEFTKRVEYKSVIFRNHNQRNYLRQSAPTGVRILKVIQLKDSTV